MKTNEGMLDRVIRVMVGLALLSLFFLAPGPLAYVGLIGLVPLLTGAIGYCPLYGMFGFNTCPLDKAKQA